MLILTGKWSRKCLVYYYTIISSKITISLRFFRNLLLIDELFDNKEKFFARFYVEIKIFNYNKLEVWFCLETLFFVIYLTWILNDFV